MGKKKKITWRPQSLTSVISTTMVLVLLGLVVLFALTARVLADSVRESALKLVLATHPETPDAPEIARKYLRFGASPRAAQAILSTARVRALEQGRFNVAYDDIRFVAPACLRHRLALNFAAVTEGREMESIVAQLVNEYVK